MNAGQPGPFMLGVDAACGSRYGRAARDVRRRNDAAN